MLSLPLFTFFSPFFSLPFSIFALVLTFVAVAVVDVVVAVVVAADVTSYLLLFPAGVEDEDDVVSVIATFCGNLTLRGYFNNLNF